MLTFHCEKYVFDIKGSVTCLLQLVNAITNVRDTNKQYFFISNNGLVSHCDFEYEGKDSHFFRIFIKIAFFCRINSRRDSHFFRIFIKIAFFCRINSRRGYPLNEQSSNLIDRHTHNPGDSCGIAGSKECPAPRTCLVYDGGNRRNTGEV